MFGSDSTFVHFLTVGDVPLSFTGGFLRELLVSLPFIGGSCDELFGGFLLKMLNIERLSPFAGDFFASFDDVLPFLPSDGDLLDDPCPVCVPASLPGLLGSGISVIRQEEDFLSGLWNMSKTFYVKDRPVSARIRQTNINFIYRIQNVTLTSLRKTISVIIL